jgi:hypothetical protein
VSSLTLSTAPDAWAGIMEGDSEKVDPCDHHDGAHLRDRAAISAACRALIDDIIRHSGPLDEDAIQAIQDSLRERA